MHPTQLLGYLLPLAALLTASRAAVGTRDENAPAKQQPLTDPLYHKEPTHQAAQPEGGSPATEFPSQKDELLDLFTRPDPDVPGYSPLLDNPNLLVHWRPGGSIRVSQHLYIAKNGSITDSRYDKADYRWKPRSLPFCADPHFPMAIVVMEPHGGAEGRPDRVSRQHPFSCLFALLLMFLFPFPFWGASIQLFPGLLRCAKTHLDPAFLHRL
jgi:hypothetical protein